MTAAKTGFETFTEVLKNMTPEHRDKLINSHQRFGYLRRWCEAKGMIKQLPNFTGLIVLKNTKEVKEIRKLIDFLKPVNFKWKYKDKALQKEYEKIAVEYGKK